MPNFVLQTPSLQHLAGIKIAAALWNHPAIMTQLAELSHCIEREEVNLKWIVLSEDVTCIISALDVTELCKQQLLQLIDPLKHEIRTWRAYYYHPNKTKEIIFLNYSLPKQFCWTMHGTIDYVKTAQLMVKDDRLSTEQRYAIACINCLEDDARHLFQLIPEERRREYGNWMLGAGELGRNYLIVFFTCTLSGGANQLTGCFQQFLSRNAFSITVDLFVRSLLNFRSNRAAKQYFFDKLNQREKEVVLMSFGDLASLMFNDSIDIPHCNLVYVWSLMSEEQREHLIRTCARNVLLSLLWWPTQSLFMEAVRCGWLRYMAYADYEKVLSAILGRINDAYSDYNYAQMFCECWRLSPTDVRRRLLDDESFLETSLKTDQKEIVNLMFNEEAPPSHLLLELRTKYRKRFKKATHMGVFSDAALMRFKANALNNLNEPQDDEKRAKSERFCRIVDAVIEGRAKRRRLV